MTKQLQHAWIKVQAGGTYSILTSDELVIFTAAGTANLPAAVASGHTLRICNQSTESVTIDADGSETINGELTQTLYPGENVIITDYATGKWC